MEPANTPAARPAHLDASREFMCAHNCIVPEAIVNGDDSDDGDSSSPASDREERRRDKYQYSDWKINPRMPRKCYRFNLYHCMVCGLQFKHLDACMAHQIEKCGLELVKVRCGICGKGFFSEKELELHFKRWHIRLDVSI